METDKANLFVETIRSCGVPHYCGRMLVFTASAPLAQMRTDADVIAKAKVEHAKVMSCMRDVFGEDTSRWLDKHMLHNAS